MKGKANRGSRGCGTRHLWLPKLLRELRVSIPTIQRWAGVSRASVSLWQDAVWAPSPTRRSVLAKAIRAHVARELALLEAWEDEAPAVGGARGERGRARGRGGVPAARN